MIKAVILDVDGVLVNSEPFILEAAARMFQERGVTVSARDFQGLVGAGEDRFIGEVADKHGLELDIGSGKQRTYELYDAIIRDRMKAIPGLSDFLDYCRGQGLKIALASASDSLKVDINLRAAGLSRDKFDSVLDASDVVRKKPFPDVYLRTAVLLGVSPTACLVLEDEVNGVKAAIAAGTRCVGVTTTFSAEELRAAGASWTATDFNDVPAESLSW